FSGVGALSIGSAADSIAYTQIHTPALSAVANQPFAHLQINPGGAVTVPTGTAAWVSSVDIEPPNITATGTVSDAYTVRIAGAPTGGTRTGALYVASGATRLDGNLEMHRGSNQYIEMKEGTAPSAPAADGVRLYVEDNGAGKTRICALFNSGSAQCFATQP